MVSYPQDWETKNVKDFGYVVTGNTPSTNVSEYWGRTHTWITPTDINNKIFVSSSERRLTEKGYSVSRRLPSGSVLVTCIASIGKNCILHGQGSCNQQINAICVNDKNYNLFIYYLMEFNKQYLENLAGITATKIIKKQIFENIEFIVPPLPEQQAIADALTAFDTHINNLSKLIEKKKMIRDGAVEDLVSGKRRLAGFSGKWEEISFNDSVIPKARIGWQGLKKDEYLQSGYSYLISGMDFYRGTISFEEISFVSKDRYDMDSNIQVKPGDVLVTKDGTIGKVAIVPNIDKRATLNSGVFVFRVIEKLKRKFLYWILRSSLFSNFIDELSAGSTIKHLYQKDLKQLKFVIPTSLTEQQAIADILTAMDKEITDLEEEKEKYMALKAGAMDDLLTGKIRLV
ncbi:MULTISPECIES: restriction endonuclease subunit S [Gardnerella]|uniref:restriction endonuclease subunit S n=1 Tax=Gardnerella TaxID=2701 RepID=UPI0015726F46|nr:restriction endonuclease subunit S [Gardnerella vaginalis]